MWKWPKNEAFKQIPLLPLVEDGYCGQKIFPDPLQWWASRAYDLPLLTPPARRVLVIPAFVGRFDRGEKAQLPTRGQC